MNMIPNRGLMFFSGFSFIFFIVYIVIAIITFILFVKLALRGIKALDIYIAKNQYINKESNDDKDNW